MPHNEPQFTPGPWRKERCELETSNGDPWCGRFLVMGPPSVDGRYCDEDASLIVAAPDMYAALVELTEAVLGYGAHREDRFLPEGWERLGTATRSARAVIAKAAERK